MPQWIDYKELKREIAFADVLEHYGIENKGNGDQVKATCTLPSHGNGNNTNTLSINLNRSIFQCFGCGAKGNVLDFIALMEGLNPKDPKAFYKAAMFARRKFLYTPQREAPASPERRVITADTQQRVIVNPPLDFELQGLDSDHPWFSEHGLTPETVRHFGMGYCKRGYMKERIAFPLHNAEGQLIGYGGIIADDSKVDADTPKCLLPSTRERNGITYQFDSSLFLYNAHDIIKPINSLILVEHFSDVWAVHQTGFPNVVASMASCLSDEQTAYLIQKIATDGCVWITPHDRSDNRLAVDVFAKIGTDRFCRLLAVPDAMMLADLDGEHVADIVSAV